MEGLKQLVITPRILDPDQDWKEIASAYDRLEKTGGLSSLYWETDGLMNASQFMQAHGPAMNRYLITVSPYEDAYRFDHMGYGTFYSLSPGLERCWGGIWLEPRWRGPNSYHIGRQLLAFVHGTIGIEHIFVSTPWRAAERFIEQLGMNYIGTMPRYHIHNGKQMDVMIYHSEREPYRLRFSQDILGFLSEEAARDLMDKLFPTKAKEG